MIDHVGIQVDDVDVSSQFYAAVLGPLGITAASREEVDAVHDAAVAAGVEVLHAPRVFPEYHPGYYAVFLRDPDGHNVEAVTHTASG